MDVPLEAAYGGGKWHPRLHLTASWRQLFTLLSMGFGAAMLGRGFRVYSWVTIVLLLAFGVWTSPYIPQLAAGEPTSGIGILERVNIYATMLWNAVLAFSLLRAHGAAAGEVGQAPKLRSAA